MIIHAPPPDDIIQSINDLYDILISRREVILPFCAGAYLKLNEGQSVFLVTRDQKNGNPNEIGN